MLINVAPRSYTSNIVADADLNLEGYNVTANAIYSKDNYLLTMLDYGEVFPTDVKEGDKVFAWGEDSTKSYIYTYKQGAWDAGVKPQHMADYYIADENRTVNFYLINGEVSGFGHGITVIRATEPDVSYEGLGLIFGPDVYIMGSFTVGLTYGGRDEFTVLTGDVIYSDCTSNFNSDYSLCGYTSSGEGTRYFVYNVLSRCNSFKISFSYMSGTSPIFVGFIYDTE